MSSNTSAFIEAASREVARTIVEAKRERDLLTAVYRQRLAELDAKFLLVADMERRVSEKLAALRDGDPGEQGIQGEQGEQGEKGEPGESIIGEKGDKGEKGERGEQGIQGEPGERGDPGERGEQGDPGEQGIQGERGLPGPRGELYPVRAWEDRVYYQGECATYDGRTYQAKQDTGKAPYHDDWICIAERGRDGENGRDGRSPQVCGTFAAGKEYAELDIVILDGASYIARHDDPGACPGDGWQVISQKGKTGKPGPKGDKGDRGERGLPGATIAHATCTLDGLLILTNSDGSEIRCDLYPVLNLVRADA